MQLKLDTVFVVEDMSKFITHGVQELDVSGLLKVVCFKEEKKKEAARTHTALVYVVQIYIFIPQPKAEIILTCLIFFFVFI